jgi:hypothetical protein
MRLATQHRDTGARPRALIFGNTPKSRDGIYTKSRDSIFK